jgi:aminoglycoside phosphotransferase (APT) family kinase protein
VSSHADAEVSYGRAVRRRFGAGARIEAVTHPTLGGANTTVVFDIVHGTTRRRVVSRQTPTLIGSPFLTGHQQFEVMRAVHAQGLPVPEPLFEYDAVDGLGEGFVVAFTSGETLPQRILRSTELARPELAGEIGGLLARLHACPTEPLGFLANVADSCDPIVAQRERMDIYGEHHPAIELGLRWLERHRPPGTAKRLLHGDFRVGNLLVGADGVRGVLDWECSHFGDVHEDLGWFCARPWRFSRPELAAGGLGTRETLRDGYEAAGGVAVDLARVRYWEVFALTRWAVLNVMQANGHVRGDRRGLVFAACGRNASLVEYDLLMTLAGDFD